MAIGMTGEELLEYTAWERERWRAWFAANRQALQVSTGPHGDGRLTTVGDIVKHVFSAELRYVQRLTDQPLTDLSAVAGDDPDALFAKGDETRRAFRHLLQSFPEEGWDTRRDLQIAGYQVTTTARKIAVHVLMHEIRHWAQVATLCRLNGFACELHDFLASPVWGGEFRRL